MGILNKFARGAFLEYHNHIYKTEGIKKLHDLYFNELYKTITWIQVKFKYHHAKEEMTLYDISLALYLDWGEEHTDRKVSPEHIVVYLVREGRIKSRKVGDVADYIVREEINQTIKDDINIFKNAYYEIKQKILKDEEIPMQNFADELGIKQKTLRGYIESLSKELGK